MDDEARSPSSAAAHTAGTMTPRRGATAPVGWLVSDCGLDDTPLYEDGLVLGKDHLRGWEQLQMLGYRSMPYMELPSAHLADVHVVLLVSPANPAPDRPSSAAPPSASSSATRTTGSTALPAPAPLFALAAALHSADGTATVPVSPASASGMRGACMGTGRYAGGASGVEGGGSPGGALAVRLFNVSEACVWVNGAPLQQGQEARLRDGDWICLTSVCSHAAEHDQDDDDEEGEDLVLEFQFRTGSSLPLCSHTAAAAAAAAAAATAAATAPNAMGGTARALQPPSAGVGSRRAGHSSPAGSPTELGSPARHLPLLVPLRSPSLRESDGSSVPHALHGGADDPQQPCSLRSVIRGPAAAVASGRGSHGAGGVETWVPVTAASPARRRQQLQGHVGLFADLMATEGVGETAAAAPGELPVKAPKELPVEALPFCPLCVGLMDTAVQLQPCRHAFCATCLSGVLGAQLQAAVPLCCPLGCPTPRSVTAATRHRTRTATYLLQSAGPAELHPFVRRDSRGAATAATSLHHQARSGSSTGGFARLALAAEGWARDQQRFALHLQRTVQPLGCARHNSTHVTVAEQCLSSCGSGGTTPSAAAVSRGVPPPPADAAEGAVRDAAAAVAALALTPVASAEADPDLALLDLVMRWAYNHACLCSPPASPTATPAPLPPTTGTQPRTCDAVQGQGWGSGDGGEGGGGSGGAHRRRLLHSPTPSVSSAASSSYLRPEVQGRGSEVGSYTSPPRLPPEALMHLSRQRQHGHPGGGGGGGEALGPVGGRDTGAGEGGDEDLEGALGELLMIGSAAGSPAQGGSHDPGGAGSPAQGGSPASRGHMACGSWELPPALWPSPVCVQAPANPRHATAGHAVLPAPPRHQQPRRRRYVDLPVFTTSSSGGTQGSGGSQGSPAACTAMPYTGGFHAAANGYGGSSGDDGDGGGCGLGSDGSDGGCRVPAAEPASGGGVMGVVRRWLAGSRGGSTTPSSAAGAAGRGAASSGRATQHWMPGAAAELELEGGFPALDAAGAGEWLPHSASLPSDSMLLPCGGASCSGNDDGDASCWGDGSGGGGGGSSPTSPLAQVRALIASHQRRPLPPSAPGASHGGDVAAPLAHRQRLPTPAVSPASPASPAAMVDAWAHVRGAGRHHGYPGNEEGGQEDEWGRVLLRHSPSHTTSTYELVLSHAHSHLSGAASAGTAHHASGRRWVAGAARERRGREPASGRSSLRSARSVMVEGSDVSDQSRARVRPRFSGGEAVVPVERKPDAPAGPSAGLPVPLPPAPSEHVLIRQWRRDLDAAAALPPALASAYGSAPQLWCHVVLGGEECAAAGQPAGEALQLGDSGLVAIGGALPPLGVLLGGGPSRPPIPRFRRRSVSNSDLGSPRSLMLCSGAAAAPEAPGTMQQVPADRHVFVPSAADGGAAPTTPRRTWQQQRGWDALVQDVHHTEEGQPCAPCQPPPTSRLGGPAPPTAAVAMMMDPLGMPRSPAVASAVFVSPQASNPLACAAVGLCGRDNLLVAAAAATSWSAATTSAFSSAASAGLHCCMAGHVDHLPVMAGEDGGDDGAGAGGDESSGGDGVGARWRCAVLPTGLALAPAAGTPAAASGGRCGMPAPTSSPRNLLSFQSSAMVTSSCDMWPPPPPPPQSQRAATGGAHVWSSSSHTSWARVANPGVAGGVQGGVTRWPRRAWGSCSGLPAAAALGASAPPSSSHATSGAPDQAVASRAAAAAGDGAVGFDGGGGASSAAATPRGLLPRLRRLHRAVLLSDISAIGPVENGAAVCEAGQHQAHPHHQREQAQHQAHPHHQREQAQPVAPGASPPPLSALTSGAGEQGLWRRASCSSLQWRWLASLGQVTQGEAGTTATVAAATGVPDVASSASSPLLARPSSRAGHALGDRESCAVPDEYLAPPGSGGGAQQRPAMEAWVAQPATVNAVGRGGGRCGGQCDVLRSLSCESSVASSGYQDAAVVVPAGAGWAAGSGGGAAVRAEGRAEETQESFKDNVDEEEQEAEVEDVEGDSDEEDVEQALDEEQQLLAPTAAARAAGLMRAPAGMHVLCALHDFRLPLDLATWRVSLVDRVLLQLRLATSSSVRATPLSNLVHTLEMLSRLAWASSEAKEALAQGGAIGRLLTVMRMFAHSPAVLASCCAALGAMVYGTDDVCLTNQWDIAKVLGVDQVVAAMQAHRGEAVLQLAALLSFAPLAHGNPMMQANITRSALPAVLGTLRAHRDMAAVQAKGMVLLGVLVQGDEPLLDAVRTCLVEAGAGTDVLAALCTHGRVSDAVLWPCLFALSLWTADGRAKHVVSTLAPLPCLVEAIRTGVQAHISRCVEAGRREDDLVVSTGLHLARLLEEERARQQQRRLTWVAALATTAMAALVCLRMYTHGSGATATAVSGAH